MSKFTRHSLSNMNECIDKRLSFNQSEANQTISYKGYKVQAYPNMGYVAVKIDGYTVSQSFPNTQKAIEEAKKRIDQMAH